MKNALCLHGLSSGLSEKVPNTSVDLSAIVKNLKDNLIIPNHCDVFLHTWHHDNINKVLSSYCPLAHSIEKHILFHKNNPIDNIKHMRRKFLLKQNHKNRKNDIMSRWYSLRESVNLALNYSKAKGFKYEKILVTRFDLMLNKKINMEDLSYEKFYTGNWSRWYDKRGNELNEIDISKGQLYKFKGKKGFPFDSEGIHDFWFASNADYIAKFALCYDNIQQLFNEAGLSSHKIALQHLKNINIFENIDYFLEFPKDYTLGRWK